MECCKLITSTPCSKPMEKPIKWTDTPEAAFKRVQSGLILFKNQTEAAAKLIWEAKTRQLWKLRYSSWKEFCEIGCGYGVRWSDQLFQKYQVKLDENAALFSGEKTPCKQVVPSKRSPLASEAILLRNNEEKCLSSEQTLTSGKSAKKSDVSKPTVVKPKAEPEPVLDKTGYAIPPELLAEWNRASQQAGGWVRAFDAIHREVMDRHGLDFALKGINKATLESDHSNYRENIKQALPHAVCGTCQGRLPKNCKTCNGLGWVNKTFWENCVPMEIKQIRDKSYGTTSSARLSA